MRPHAPSIVPYAVVRHAFYAGLAPFFPASGLLLDSWWAALVSVPMIAALAWRAVREERYLAQQLEGYSDYMKKVRYRLIPCVW
jgi:protein-S-isoprenylcysteine O-methyltransferase Ste14